MQVEAKVKRRDGTAQKRAYTIKKVSRDTAASFTFEHNGQAISVAQYYQQQYGQALQYPRL